MSEEYGQTLAAFVLDTGKDAAAILEADPGDRRRRRQREDRRCRDRRPDEAPGQGPPDHGSRRRQRHRPWSRARRHRRSDRPRAGRRRRRRGGGWCPERPAQPPARHRDRRQVHAQGHEGARPGEERRVHPVRRQLGRVHRDDRAGHHGREGPPDLEHAAAQDGAALKALVDPAVEAARRRGGRVGLRGRGPRGGPRRGGPGRGCRAGRSRSGSGCDRRRRPPTT